MLFLSAFAANVSSQNTQLQVQFMEEKANLEAKVRTLEVNFDNLLQVRDQKLLFAVNVIKGKTWN